MSDFMQDIADACKLASDTSQVTGMFAEELQTADRLLQKYGDERDRMFEAMLYLLGQSDTSNLRDEWRSVCEKGTDLLEHLDSEMPKGEVLKAYEGLAGVGAANFAEGEKKIWAENTKADIASIADIISKIYSADLELIKKLNEDLKKAREDGAIADALLDKTFGTIRSTVLDFSTWLAATVVPNLIRAAVGGIMGGILRDKARALREGLTNAKSGLTAADTKRICKKILLDNLQLIDKTKEKLSGEWIEELYKKGEEFAKALPGVGANGEYKAADWRKFGEECIKKLAERRDQAKEYSAQVFNNIRPEFVKSVSGAFAALTADPSTLANWKGELQDNAKAIYDGLAEDDNIIAGLASDALKASARGILKEIREQVTEDINDLLEKIKDAEEKMKI